MKKRLLLIGCVLMMSTAAVACSSTNQSTEAKQENMDSNKTCNGESCNIDNSKTSSSESL